MTEASVDFSCGLLVLTGTFRAVEVELGDVGDSLDVRAGEGDRDLWICFVRTEKSSFSSKERNACCRGGEVAANARGTIMIHAVHDNIVRKRCKQQGLQRKPISCGWFAVGGGQA